MFGTREKHETHRKPHAQPTTRKKDRRQKKRKVQNWTFFFLPLLVLVFSYLINSGVLSTELPYRAQKKQKTDTPPQYLVSNDISRCRNQRSTKPHPSIHPLTKSFFVFSTINRVQAKQKSTTWLKWNDCCPINAKCLNILEAKAKAYTEVYIYMYIYSVELYRYVMRPPLKKEKKISYWKNKTRPAKYNRKKGNNTKAVSPY